MSGGIQKNGLWASDKVFLFSHHLSIAMKIRMLICLLLVQVSANADWVKVTENKRGNGYYLDPQTLITEGDKRSVLELIDYKKPDRDGDRSVRVEREYDCKEKKFRVQNAYYHKGAMGEGEISLTSAGTLGWTDIDMKSPAAAMLTYLCQ